MGQEAAAGGSDLGGSEYRSGGQAEAGLLSESSLLSSLSSDGIGRGTWPGTGYPAFGENCVDSG